MTHDRLRLDGRVAVVTGAGRGIGRAEAALLAAQGARVIINDLGGDPTGAGGDAGVAAAAAAEIVAQGGEALANDDDIATFLGAQSLIEQAMDAFGRIDILINNAGILRPKLIDDLSEEDWDRVIAVNLKGTFNTTRHAAREFKRLGGGVVVNTSSHSGLGHYAMSPYAAAKEGVLGFTRSIAKDLGPYGVRCNAIRPGAKSRMGIPELHAKVREAQEQFGFSAIGDEWFPPGSPAAPETAAALAVWLCTDAAQRINGRTFMILGNVVGLYPEPKPVRLLLNEAGWDLASLDRSSSLLIADLQPEFGRRPASGQRD